MICMANIYCAAGVEIKRQIGVQRDASLLSNARNVIGAQARNHFAASGQPCTRACSQQQGQALDGPSSAQPFLRRKQQGLSGKLWIALGAQ